MRTLATASFVVSVLGLLAPLHADPPAAIPGDRSVGSVYGRAITANDIGLTKPVDPAVRFDARDSATWELIGRVLAAFGRPITERFIAEKQIGATADEIAAFRDNSTKRRERQILRTEERLTKVKADLASPDLPEKKKAELEKTQASLEKVLAALRDTSRGPVAEDVARHFIVAWKVERELHRTYGGRVIFQQAGPEALDARRQLFEQAEKNGDLKFQDPGVRHLFYYYANMKHTEADDKALERPWFLEKPE